MILVVIVFLFVLKQLSGLLLPLILAGMFTILVMPIVNFLENHKVPHSVTTIFISAISLGLIFSIIMLLSGTVQQIITDREILAEQLNQKTNLMIEWAGRRFPVINVDSFREQSGNFLSSLNIPGVIGSFISSLGTLSSSFVLFMIYYIILLSRANCYHSYVDYVTGEDRSGRKRHVWKLTQESISAYMGIKTLISLVTGILTGFICVFFGLRFSLLWGLLAFMLNFIPSIGSIFAAAIPALMGVIQFTSVGSIVGLSVSLVVCQFIIGSVIDPMIMGNRLRLNAVTVIFGLLFWGYIWGIPGMLLSVPLTVLLRLLLEQSESLSIIARVMGNSSQVAKSSLFNRIITSARQTEGAQEQSAGQYTGQGGAD